MRLASTESLSALVDRFCGLGKHDACKSYLIALENEYSLNLPENREQYLDEFGLYFTERRKLFSRIAEAKKRVGLLSGPMLDETEPDTEHRLTNVQILLLFEILEERYGFLKGAPNNQRASFLHILTGRPQAAFNNKMSERSKEKLNIGHDWSQLGTNSQKKAASERKNLIKLQELGKNCGFDEQVLDILKRKLTELEHVKK